MTTSTFDLSFRPASYFGPQSLHKHITSRISGNVRRRLVREALDSGDAVPTALLRSTLDDATLKAFTATGPWMLGGEFIPDQQRDEVEVARVSLESVTADQVVVRVRRSGSRLRYSVHDEYDDEYIARRYGPRSSANPLTMAQLITLIDSAYNVFEVIEANIEGGADPAEMETFVSVASDFYPQLTEYYARQIAAWIAENHAPEGDGHEPPTDADAL